MERTVTLNEMHHAAAMYGGVVKEADARCHYPYIDFGDGILEATDSDFSDPVEDGDEVRYSGFRFVGPNAAMHRPEVTACFNFLTLPVVKHELLTIARAEALRGKKLRLSYCDVNEGDYTIIIDGMDDVSNNGMIGQGPTYKWLRFREVMDDGSEQPGTWIYEWQGIFRRGSGAERLFVEEVVSNNVKP